MSVTVQQFKNRYPVFVDETKYPSATVQLFIDEAELTISECIFKNYYDMAIMLHTAHYLSLETDAAKWSDTKGPSQAFATVLPISTASVGDVTVSKEVSNIQDAGSQYGTLTGTYFGQRLITLMKTMGAGAEVIVIRNTTPVCGEEGTII